MSNPLIAKLLAQRESRFEVMPGRWITIRRPGEVEMAVLRGGLSIDKLKAFVVGWEAFTEADLLGAAVGSSSAVPFDAEVFGTWIVDRAEEFSKAADELMRLVSDHLKAKAEAAKN